MQVLKKPAIIETIRLNRLCWFGHVQRMEENRLPKRVIYEFENNKTERYMIVERKNSLKKNKKGHLKIKKYKFERVENVKYLGVILNEDKITKQTCKKESLKHANKTYFMLQIFFKNKNISRNLNLRLKDTIIDKMVTYASETWTLTKTDGKQLNIF